MTFAASYVNAYHIADVIKGNLALDMEGSGIHSVKAALFTDSITGQDKSTAERYGVGTFASNQVTSTNYTAGGIALNTPAVSVTSGVVKFYDSVNATVYWAGPVTFTTAGLVVWDDTVTTPNADPVLACIKFGAPVQCVTGTMTVTWATAGIFTLTF